MPKYVPRLEGIMHSPKYVAGNKKILDACVGVSDVLLFIPNFFLVIHIIITVYVY